MKAFNSIIAEAQATIDSTLVVYVGYTVRDTTVSSPVLIYLN